MRKIITTTFITLDGVMQAPGGPEEDRHGGFKYGGWMFNYVDEIIGKTIDQIMDLPFDLLLGKRTYDIFASYWPSAREDLTVAKKFNSTKKYVVSKSETNLSWHNSSLITGDVVEQLKNLKKDDGNDLWVHGSGDLIQTLLAHDLIDRMLIWIFPVTIGNGKRLFGTGTKALGLKLVDSKISENGVIIATYEPAEPLKTGTIGG